MDPWLCIGLVVTLLLVVLEVWWVVHSLRMFVEDYRFGDDVASFIGVFLCLLPALILWPLYLVIASLVSIAYCVKVYKKRPKGSKSYSWRDPINHLKESLK